MAGAWPESDQVLPVPERGRPQERIPAEPCLAEPERAGRDERSALRLLHRYGLSETAVLK